MRIAVTAFALFGLLCGSAAAADLANERAGSAVSVDVVAAQMATTQREVRQALVDATVTQNDTNELMVYLNTFVRNYTSAVVSRDPDAVEHSLEEYLAGKVAPRLEGVSLSTAEAERVLTLTRTWVGLELSQIDAGRLDREVRR